MSTDCERRHVAKRLREYAKHSCSGGVDLEDFGGTVVNTMGLNCFDCEGTTAYERLASYIEPEYTKCEHCGEVYCPRTKRTEVLNEDDVCLMIYHPEWSYDEFYPTEAYECSICGYVTIEGVPNYCPNCGKKVGACDNGY